MEDKQIISEDDQQKIDEIGQYLTKPGRVALYISAPFIMAYYGVKIGFRTLIYKIKEFLKRCKK